jgi:hypothetical protein
MPHLWSSTLAASTLLASLAVSSPAFAQPPGSESAPPPQPSSDSEPTAVVHVNADAPVVLQERDADASDWSPACVSPCNAALPLSASYRIVGANVRSSPVFRLDGTPSERVALDVSTTSKGSFVTGMAVTIAGGGSVLLGGAVLALNWFQGALSCTGGSETGSGFEKHCGPNGAVDTAGYILVGAGAVALVAGTVVLATHWRSHVAVAQSTDASRPRADAWLRLPQWREDKTTAALPKALGMPLFATAF